MAWSIIIEAMLAAVCTSPPIAPAEAAGRDTVISNHASKAVTRRRRELAKRRRDNGGDMYTSLRLTRPWQQLWSRSRFVQNPRSPLGR